MNEPDQFVPERLRAAPNWKRLSIAFLLAALTAAFVFFVIVAYVRVNRDLDEIERAVGTGKIR